MTQQAASNRTKELQKKRGENPYAEGTRYYDMWNANPYAWDKFTRKRSVWDDLAEAWGIRSGYQAAEDEWAKAQSEYDAQIAQLKGEDEYNTPQAEAARMRAAGQNPDLLGTQGVAEAGEFAQEQSSPNVNAESEEVNKVLGFISEIPKAITFAMSITQEGAKTMGMLYDLNTKKVETNEKMMNLANKFINDFTFDQIDEGKGEKFNLESIAKTIKEEAYNWAVLNGFSKNEANRFSNNVRSQVQGRKEDLYNKFINQRESRRNYGLARGKAGSPKGDTEDEIMSAVGGIVDEMNSALMDNLHADALAAENRKDYETSKDGGLQAEGENAENEMKKSKGKLVENARMAVEKAHEKLEEYINKGNFMAITMDSALSAMYLKYLE